MSNMEKVNLDNVKDINELNAMHNEWFKVQEQAFNECRQRLIREEREKKRRDEELFRENLAKSVSEENSFSMEVARIIVDKAWEDGHSCGLDEVRTYAHIYSEFVEKIINALCNDGTIPMFAG